MKSNNQWEATWPTTHDPERQAEDTTSSPRSPVFGVLALVGALSMLVGSFGPWVRFSLWYEVSGTSSLLAERGLWTAGCGALASLLLAVSLANRGHVIAAGLIDGASLLALLIGTWLGVITWREVALQNDFTWDLENSVAVGWGLILVTIGGGVGTFCSLVHVRWE